MWDCIAYVLKVLLVAAIALPAIMFYVGVAVASAVPLAVIKTTLIVSAVLSLTVITVVRVRAQLRSRADSKCR